jgi:hypothetical protein
MTRGVNGQIRTDNDLIISVSVIIFWIRIWIGYSTDIRTLIGYWTNTNKKIYIF